jgi:exodeoxyribonuclease VII small subunit
VSDVLDRPPSLEALRHVAEGGSFEEALQALEQVVAHLERGRLSIDEAVNWYEVGLGLTRRCTDALEQAELRINTLEESYGLDAGENDRGDANDAS